MTLERLSDNELAALLRTASGSDFENGFRELMRRYKNQIVSFLFRYTSDLKTAEDLAQEAFVRVLRNIKAFNPTARFSTWLYTIASNLAKDEFKRRGRHPAMSMDWQSSARHETTKMVPAISKPDHNPERAAEDTERSELVQKALADLDDQDREILILREMQGLKYEEISLVLGLPLGTVKSRIARARMSFKTVWEKKCR